MRTNGYMATALSVTLFSAAALADDYPARKPGLWEVTSHAEVGHATTTKMCIDPETDQLFHKMGTDLRSIKHCERDDVKVDGDTVTTDSECKLGSATETTTGVIKFTGDSAYHADITIHFDPAVLGKSDTSITQDGKWTGDCPAGMKPGDLVLANGFKINVKTLNFFKSLIPGKM
jgi:Protein of unknown function (DUF3617)